MRNSDDERLVGISFLVGVFLLGIWLLLSSCSSSSSSVQPTAAEGLNLHALVGVVRQASNGEDLERRLNTAGGINNLDLDQDGKVDFLDVTEFGDGEFRGYSLAVHLGADEKNSTQEVAEVKIHQGPNDFTIQVKGNEQIYGGHSFVTSRIARNEMSQVPFLLWAFAPRPVYVHPFVAGYPYRPAWYAPPVVIPVKQYRTVTTQVTKTVVVERPKAPVLATPATVTNPNAGKTAETVKATLAVPTTTQKEFQARPENKPVASGGFGAQKTKEKEAVTTTTTPPPSPPAKTPVDQGTLQQRKPEVQKDNTVQQFQQRAVDKPVETGGFGASKAQGKGQEQVTTPTPTPAQTPRPPTPAPTPQVQRTPPPAPAPVSRPSSPPSSTSNGRR